jgi:MoxR-like ATPase
MTPTTAIASRNDIIELEGSSVFRVPQEDPHFVVTPEQKAFLRGVQRLAQDGQVNVGLRGPKGTGKTSIPEWFAAKTGRPFFLVDVPTLREPKDIFGFKDVASSAGVMSLVWKRSGFVRAVTTPNAVVVLDEATRVHASVLNGLLPLLDHRRKVYLDDLGETIEVAPGVVFFLTANIGIEYTGTWQWDAALEDRLSYQIEVTYLPKEQEIEVLVAKTGVDRTIASRLCEVAELVRRRVTDPSEPLSHAISTRQLLATARLCREGIGPKDALEFTVLPTYSAEGGETSPRANVLQIIQGKIV